MSYIDVVNTQSRYLSRNIRKLINFYYALLPKVSICGCKKWKKTISRTSFYQYHKYMSSGVFIITNILYHLYFQSFYIIFQFCTHTKKPNPYVALRKDIQKKTLKTLGLVIILISQTQFIFSENFISWVYPQRISKIYKNTNTYNIYFKEKKIIHQLVPKTLPKFNANDSKSTLKFAFRTTITSHPPTLSHVEVSCYVNMYVAW